MGSVFVKIILWAILTALAYHIVGGIRHLLADFGFMEETLVAGKRSAIASFIIAAILSILAGVILW